MKAGLIVGIGLRGRKDDNDVLHIQALVLRTSALTTEHPYLVEIWVNVSADYGKRVVEGKSAECACPAGESSKCKHVIAVMLQLGSMRESDLDDLTCTDIEQQWGAMKKTKLNEYQAKPLKEFCHYGTHNEIYAQKLPEVTKEMGKIWVEKLSRCAPTSEYSIAFSGLRTGLGVADSEEEAASAARTVDEKAKIVSKLLTFRSHKVLGVIGRMTEQKVSSLSEELQDFYEEHINRSLEECVVIGCAPQGSDAWLAARKKTLNASKARAQFTYYSNSKANWDSRYRDVYHKTVPPTAYMKAGLEAEEPARELYEDIYSLRIFQSGTLIRPEVPWLACSLDGSVLDKFNEFLKNLEIKTFKEGERLTAQEMLTMAAIRTLDQNGNLRVATDHYAQIQLGMLISGMTQCDYLVYSPCGKDCIVITVPFDEKHVLLLCSSLVHVYFDEFLPRMMADVLNHS